MASATDLLSLTYEGVNGNGYVCEKDRDAFFRVIRSRKGNRICFDCTHRNPTWVSLTFGVFLCLNCSGNHRRLGTHISFVRSTDLDQFTVPHLLKLELGGNERARKYFRDYGQIENQAVEWHSKTASRYKHTLETEVEKILVDKYGDSEMGNRLIESSHDNGDADDDEDEDDDTLVDIKASNRPSAPSTLFRPHAASKAQPIEDLDFDFDEFEKTVVPLAEENKAFASEENTAYFSSSGGLLTTVTKSDKIYEAPLSNNGVASTRFGGAKSISSSQYFDKSPDTVKEEKEAKEALQKFSGSSAISSDQFFGRPEESEGRRGSNANWGLDNETAEHVAQFADGAKQHIKDFASRARDWLSKNLDFPDV
eukprot:GHVO01004313.1.p1 GENE.GHVO01004313.1~~GHVO01004313.1.p1  ORF type:complete len:367 (-),score=59.18 GHVO01004313.1:189-1289(-)